LSLFAVIQSALFIVIGNTILEIRGMFWPYLWFIGTTAVSGVAGGLLISAVVDDAKTAANIVPLVLIPQIILGGALIKYEEMNRNLDFIYALTRDRMAQDAVTGGKVKGQNVEVPLICELIPMRWAYEALVDVQAKLNPFTSRQDLLSAKIDALAHSPKLTSNEEDRLEDLKEALAILSGLGGKNTSEVNQRLHLIDQVIAGKALDENKFDRKDNSVTAEQLFQNKKISDMLVDAEMKQRDYTSKQRNVFFGPEKLIFGQTISIFVFDSLVINGFTVIFLIVVLWRLHRQFRIG
jgi:ABC transport system ATP-binding/permease protein